MEKHKIIMDSLVRKKVRALEADISNWLANNRQITKEEKICEIIDCIKAIDLPNEVFLALLAEMFIMVDNSRYIMKQEKNFIPILKAGVKSLRSAHINAAKPRKGGRNGHLAAIKKVMSRNKKEGQSFCAFIDSLEADSVDDLVMLRAGNKYTIYHIDFAENPIVTTLQNLASWYSRRPKSINNFL